MIDPKTFITAPFQQCPQCGGGLFGVLMICPKHYVRRCRDCWHAKSIDLPLLKKKVMYLDQFVISNMMKALNPNATLSKGEANGFWRDLFRTVDRLCKLQLLICPQSALHRQESIVSPFPAPLKRMYELLSGGVKLYDSHAVQRLQFYEHVQSWARGEEPHSWNFDLQTITHSDPHGWQEKFNISFNWKFPDDWIDEVRRSRKTVHEGLVEVFEGWQKEKQRFEQYFSEEAQSYGRVVLEIFSQRLQRLQNILSGRSKPSVGDILVAPAELTVGCVQDGLRKAGIAESELLHRTIDYLLSDAMERVPFNRISSMLYAAIARQAAAGRKRPPTRGIANDIDMISAYLPYCDAIFVDKECHGYLIEQPLRDELDYGCRVFSLNAKEDLLCYLESIEKEAPVAHLAKVKEVYGDDWGIPFESLYDAPGA